MLAARRRIAAQNALMGKNNTQNVYNIQNKTLINVGKGATININTNSKQVEENTNNINNIKSELNLLKNKLVSKGKVFTPKPALEEDLKLIRKSEKKFGIENNLKNQAFEFEKINKTKEKIFSKFDFSKNQKIYTEEKILELKNKPEDSYFDDSDNSIPIDDSFIPIEKHHNIIKEFQNKNAEITTEKHKLYQDKKDMDIEFKRKNCKLEEIIKKLQNENANLKLKISNSDLVKKDQQEEIFKLETQIKILLEKIEAYEQNGESSGYKAIFSKLKKLEEKHKHDEELFNSMLREVKELEEYKETISKENEIFKQRIQEVELNNIIDEDIASLKYYKTIAKIQDPKFSGKNFISFEESKKNNDDWIKIYNLISNSFENKLEEINDTYSKTMEMQKIKKEQCKSKEEIIKLNLENGEYVQNFNAMIKNTKKNFVHELDEMEKLFYKERIEKKTREEPQLVPISAGSYGLNNCFWISVATMAFVRQNLLQTPDYYMGFAHAYGIDHDTANSIGHNKKILDEFGISIYSNDDKKVVEECYRANPVYIYHENYHFSPASDSEGQKIKILEYLDWLKNHENAYKKNPKH